MNRKRLRFSAAGGLVLVSLAIVALVVTRTAAPSAPQPPRPTATPRSGPASAQVAVLRAVFDDIHRAGFNPTAPPDKNSSLQGGLYINWRGTWDGAPATAPHNTNIQTSGIADAEDAGASSRHDPMTDLTYLRNLLVYRHSTGDTSYDSDITRMAPIVKAEFDNYTVYRAWLYSQLRDMDRADPTGGWSAMSDTYAATLFRRYYDASAGTIIDPQHRSYRVDWAAESAAALLDAGKRQGNSAWTDAGAATIKHLLAYARDPQTHLFPLVISTASGRDTVQQAQLKVGAEAQLLDALCSAYDITHDQATLDAVEAAVNELYSPTLRLWDSIHGGFYFSVNADGTKLQTSYKESRQGWMVTLLHHLDAEPGHSWSAEERQMLTVMTSNFYQQALRGYPYRETLSFQLYVNAQGPNHAAVVEDWVTSEADGIAGEALLTALP